MPSPKRIVQLISDNLCRVEVMTGESEYSDVDAVATMIPINKKPNDLLLLFWIARQLIVTCY